LMEIKMLGKDVEYNSFKNIFYENDLSTTIHWSGRAVELRGFLECLWYSRMDSSNTLLFALKVCVRKNGEKYSEKTLRTTIKPNQSDAYTNFKKDLESIIEEADRE